MVLDGKNAIIVSATASGKTEAVIAPLIERYLKEVWKDMGCVSGRVGNIVKGMAIQDTG